MPEDKEPIYRRIPGFRSGAPWKMLFAGLMYLFIALVLFSSLGDAGGFIMLLGLFGFLVGCIRLFKDVRARAPLKTVAIMLVVSFLAFSVGAAMLPPGEEPAHGDDYKILEETPAPDLEEVAGPDLDAQEGPDLEAETEEGTETQKEVAKEDAAPSPPSATAPGGTLKAHFIDVGQGDAILIQTPSQNILIDAGERGNTVVNYLKSQGVHSLDLVIGTHPHADHIGGLINVMEALPVKEVIDPGVAHTTKTFEDYLTLIDRKDIPFTEGRAGMSRDLGGGAKMQILHPSSPSSSHLNNASIVVRITFDQVSFMLTGDVEATAESRILGRGYTLTSTVLKVGHHGSSTSTTSSFLRAVNPGVAVIMCGSNNRYGHPHEETLANLSAAGVDIYRTDKQGTIIVTTNGQTYDINVKQPYRYTPASFGEAAEPDPEPEPSESAEPDPEPEPSRGIYVGSKKSDKYHDPDCRHAKNILPENEIWFDSVEEAKKAGYVPCGGCKPPG